MSDKEEEDKVPTIKVTIKEEKVPELVSAPALEPRFSLGTKFLSKQGELNVPDLVGAHKVVGLFFGASFCYPTLGFLPKLVSFYNDVNIESKVFEIVLVSFDKTEEDFAAFYKQMPWLALPFKDARAAQYQEHYEIIGVPMLVILRRDLSVAIPNAKHVVFNVTALSKDPEEDFNSWVAMIEG